MLAGLEVCRTHLCPPLPVSGGLGDTDSRSTSQVAQAVRFDAGDQWEEDDEPAEWERRWSPAPMPRESSFGKPDEEECLANICFSQSRPLTLEAILEAQQVMCQKLLDHDQKIRLILGGTGLGSPQPNLVREAALPLGSALHLPTSYEAEENGDGELGDVDEATAVMGMAAAPHVRERQRHEDSFSTPSRAARWGGAPTPTDSEQESEGVYSERHELDSMRTAFAAEGEELDSQAEDSESEEGAAAVQVAQAAGVGVVALLEKKDQGQVAAAVPLQQGDRCSCAEQARGSCQESNHGL